MAHSNIFENVLGVLSILRRQGTPVRVREQLPDYCSGLFANQDFVDSNILGNSL